MSQPVATAVSEYRFDLGGPCPICGSQPLRMQVHWATTNTLSDTAALPPRRHTLEPCGHDVMPISFGCSPSYPAHTPADPLDTLTD